MSNFHCCSGDVSLETRFYLSLQFGSNSLFSLGNDAFSAMCEVCRKGVQPVSWGTNTEMVVLILGVICMYSTLLSEVE